MIRITFYTYLTNPSLVAIVMVNELGYEAIVSEFMANQQPHVSHLVKNPRYT